MDHTPFEEWLLSDEKPDAHSRQAMDGHLAECRNCTELAQAWQEVHAEIRRAPQAVPAPGFSSRFAARLELASLQRQRRITWLVLSVLVVAAISGAIYYLYQQAGALPTPYQLVIAVLDSYHTLAGATHLVQSMLRTLPVPLTVGMWVAAASSLLFWLLVWFVLVWRLPNRKGVRNEAYN